MRLKSIKNSVFKSFFVQSTETKSQLRNFFNPESVPEIRMNKTHGLVENTRSRPPLLGAMASKSSANSMRSVG